MKMKLFQIALLALVLFYSTPTKVSADIGTWTEAVDCPGRYWTSGNITWESMLKNLTWYSLVMTGGQNPRPPTAIYSSGWDAAGYPHMCLYMPSQPTNKAHIWCGIGCQTAHPYDHTTVEPDPDADSQAMAFRFADGSQIDPATGNTIPYNTFAETPPFKNDEVKNGEAAECPGCIIHVETQVLGERIPVVGTPFSLNYVSERIFDFRANSTVNIPVTGPTVPVNVINSKVTIEVVGQIFEFEQLPAPNITLPFTWDGLDAQGYPVVGPVEAVIKIEMEFDTNFVAAREYEVEFNSSDFRGMGLGGWTLDQHHYYNPMEKILYLGNGDRRSDENMNSIITTAIGGGGSNPSSIEQQGPLGVSFIYPEGVVADDAGNVYASGTYQSIIVRLNADGSGERITSAGGGFTGDGGPATNAKVNNPKGLALDSQGNLYIADTYNQRVRKIDTNGIISTIAGSGLAISWAGAFAGDGGPATSARLNNPTDVAVDSAGNLYILDTNNYRIRMVDTNGIISTVAGDGTYPSSSIYGEGGPAVDAKISPQAITIDPNDNLIIGGGYWILKVDNAGIISTLAGTGPDDRTTGPYGDGILATDSVLSPL